MFKAFGKVPKGEHLRRVKASPNFRDGNFHTVEKTEMMVKEASCFKIIRDFFFRKIEGREPQSLLPSVKTDLNTLPDGPPVIVWFGHSSYLIRINRRNILVDPVFGLSPSPFQQLGKKYYPGTMPFSTDDLPELDAIIITHDHYDHLDYPTISKIKGKPDRWITTLGVGTHLESWGVDQSRITEFDWWQREVILGDIKLTATPSRHFSGRTFKRNQSLWASFMLETNTHKIFIGSDSGYDGTFRKIGEEFGPIDLAILECGQYNKMWPLIHMTPEETIQAGVDIKAKVVLPVHWGKFTLSIHPWKDPIVRATARAKELGVKLTTPMIGEPIVLDEHLPDKHWWDEVV